MANCMDPNELLKPAKDIDRAELIKKLKDLEDDTANFIDQLPRNQNRKPWTLDEWDEQIQSHPLFMTKPPTEGEEMSPLVEALQKLKYDPEENSANELAMSYKEDGNFNFKNKKYRWAVDSYTKGLEADCSDKELTVQLYSNRAAAHYYIGNYVKSLRDAEAAKSIKPDHFKALQRGAQCCFKLLKFQDCINWCQEGLKVCPDDKTLSELKEKAATKKKMEDRDKRMANILEERNKRQEIKIKKIFQERNIHFVKDVNFPEFDAMGSDAVRGKIQVDKDDKLVFPVMMLYPEYGTTDYIREFNEESNFLDHFQVMFNENDLPGWDEERKYVPQNLQVYFSYDEHLVPVKSTETLKNVLCHPRFQVTPAGVFFYITVSGSKFDSEFRSKYKICGYEENI